MSTTEVQQESPADVPKQNADNDFTGETNNSVTDNNNQFGEFNYRPVSPLAPITLFFGLCSAAGFLAWEAVAIAIVGTILGLITVWKIRRSKGELGGGILAKVGLVLSVFCLIGGSSYQAYAYITEVPEGHQRISFNWLSRQEPETKDGKFKLHPNVTALDGKEIYLRGYMYPSQKVEGITDFVLVKDSGDCCFGGNPPITDMIMVHLHNGLDVDLRGQNISIGIGGKLRLGELRRGADGLLPIYTLEGYHVR